VSFTARSATRMSAAEAAEAVSTEAINEVARTLASSWLSSYAGSFYGVVPLITSWRPDGG
jgi:hypothetical protein